MSEALTDDAVTTFIDDPATIPDHETALQVIETLDAEIAAIQAQIDAEQFRWNGRPLPADREDWVRRATYAAAMKRQQIARAWRRDKEIRCVKGPAQPQSRKDPGEGLAKQERLREEAAARRQAASVRQQELDLERQKLAAQRSRDRRFVTAARGLLDAETIRRIEAQAAALDGAAAVSEEVRS